MSSRIIEPVKDNMEKYETYKALMSRYNLAIKYKFYYEALMIDYALIEDRLRSWLYHIGVVPARDSIKVSAISKKEISPIVDEYRTEKEKKGLGYGTISSKIKIIRALLKWTENSTFGYQESKYLSALKGQLEGTDIREMVDILDCIEEWKAYRNEIVHAMMNKNIESLELELEEYAIKGKQYSDILAKNLKVFKKGNKVRKAAKLSMN